MKGFAVQQECNSIDTTGRAVHSKWDRVLWHQGPAPSCRHFSSSAKGDAKLAQVVDARIETALKRHEDLTQQLTREVREKCSTTCAPDSMRV